ncbi:hypothetical protein WBP06_24825 [Novosphingobium sp. BL-8H]|uniref:hypothetical protein n=1 Tax=Novosphingobium sp. BL-8H TaxID=3127640 RepID=UPI00375819E5
MKLQSAFANRLAFHDGTRSDPLAIQLNYDDGSRLLLRCGGDGAGLIVDDRALDASADLGEYGRLVEEDVTQAICSDMVGRDIATVATLKMGAVRVGVQLTAPTGEVLCIWNYGDALHWGDAVALARCDWAAPLRLSCAIDGFSSAS